MKKTSEIILYILLIFTLAFTPLVAAKKTLSEDEIDALLKDMKYDTTLRCPHGRPVTAKISRTEIDKWFKRIV